MGHQWRARSPAHVLEEIKYLKDTYNIEHIFFEDDNLTLNPSRAEQIFKGMIGMNLTWSTPNGIRADRLTPSLIDTMKRSGCTQLTIAIESGDQDFLDNVIHKKIKLVQIEASAKLIRSKSIDLSAFYIFGIPNESPQAVENTIKFAKKLARIGVRPYFNIAIPLPGTELYKTAKNNGLLTKNSFDPTDYLLAMQKPLLKNGHDLLKLRSRAIKETTIELLLHSPSSLLRSESFNRFKENPLKALTILQRGTC